MDITKYSYISTEINQTLTGRTSGTPILPSKHEAMAKDILDFSYAAYKTASGEDKIKKVSGNTVTITPNVLYIITIQNTTSNVTITLSDNYTSASDVKYREYMVRVKKPGTNNIIFSGVKNTDGTDASIVWIGDVSPDEDNNTYDISIIGNIGVCGSVSI